MNGLPAEWDGDGDRLVDLGNQGYLDPTVLGAAENGVVGGDWIELAVAGSEVAVGS